MNKKELEQVICELLDIPSINAMIDSQISKFIKQHGYSYKDIGRAVYFYVEVLGKKLKKEMGIGIVPYIMDDTKKYFYKKQLEEKKRSEQAKILKETNASERVEILVKPKREKRGIIKIKIEEL